MRANRKALLRFTPRMWNVTRTRSGRFVGLMNEVERTRPSLTTARRLAFVLQRRYKQFDYVEDAPSNHAAVGVTSLTMGFDFFDAVRAGKWKPSGKPLPLPSYPRN